MFLVQTNIIQDDEKRSFESEITNSVPYIPEFPFISRNFNVPRISITQAIQKSANIVVCGMSGSGKTVALAHLASCLARNDARCGVKSGKIPLYINVHELDISVQTDQTAFEVFTKFLSKKLPSSLIPKLSNFLHNEFIDNNIILIIDGLDELHPKEFDHYVDFIIKTKNEFSDLQMIVTSSTLYFGRLLELDFTPLFLSSWSNDQIKIFYTKWHQLWNKEILKENTSNIEKTNNSLVFNWISTNLRPLSPLEYTLYIWGALSGDLSGNCIVDFLQSYVKRLLPDKDLLELTQSCAVICLENGKCAVNALDSKNEAFSKIIPSGLFQQTSNGKYVFNHIEIVAYIASLFEIENPQRTNIPDLSWSVSYSYYGYLSTKSPEFDGEQSWINKDSPAFPFNLLQISHWLKLSNQNSIWKSNYIKQLVKIIQNVKMSQPIRIRAIGGLVLSNDSSLPSFFRQLLSQNDDLYRQLALFAISCANRDETFTNEIISLSQKSTYPLQKYVSLALSTYDHESSIHELARVLLSGEEKVRQLIAECLAFKSTTGEEILKEAVTMEDIVVRRSAIYGLVKLNNLWALQTLRNLVIQDSQWVIRNAATQALEFLESENPDIPERKAPIFDNNWILEFAGKHNLGISDSHSSLPILLTALQSENQKDQSIAILLSIQVANLELIEKMEEIASSSKDQELLNQILITLFLLNKSHLSESGEVKTHKYF
ncbi:MAG: HEAT repeat domain-containing protein [Anaerolineaceae bacterium]|nr:HEAT repeat domain-containing protein [Anaerolineaceae bacterium]